MKQRIYKRLVIGDENEVSRDEYLWIDNSDGTVDIKKRDKNGVLVSIVKPANEGSKLAITSVEEKPELILD